MKKNDDNQPAPPLELKPISENNPSTEAIVYNSKK